MLFNSYEFILVFLPLTVAGFFTLGARSPRLGLGWIVLMSLAFYAWWRPLNVLIIAPSIVVNFGLARLLLRLRRDGGGRAGAARLVLAAGIVFNVLFLGYFKYVNFLATASNDLLGTHFVLTQIVLPLGISFITFQKIAFLIDVHGGRIESFSFGDYALFVLFFPQLVAGPIVHYREMMPQFHQASCRPDGQSLAVGLSLFVFGLFKKVVLADGIAEHVSPLYDAAAGSAATTLLPAWIAAVGFTLQIYFDFSGYSDMALGLARLFGIKLPANFDSPLKATSIIDFWLRWHMTLTRFLTAYLYNPLTLWLTRRRMARKLPGLGGRGTSVGAFLVLLAGPTLLTMLVSGVWHGAGYLFIAWGLLHGVYLCIAHAWRLFVRPRLAADKQAYERRMRPVGFVLTFLAVVVAMVLFRSPDGHVAMQMLRGMAGTNGLALPAALQAHLGPLQSVVHVGADMSTQALAAALGWIAVLLAIALLLPNTLEMLAAWEPALGVRPRPATALTWQRVLGWTPTLPWAVCMSALVVAAVLRLGGKSEFLYWQF
jgi:D-alanyl-lipoteichoic acid acyltransferase DltB (MBOAT superfamily)